MFLSNMRWPRLARPGPVVAALGMLLLAAAPAAAQYPVSSPLTTRGWQITRSLMANQRRAERPAPMPHIPATPQVVTQEPRYVTVIGPDGRARTFQIEGPVVVVQPAPRVVRYGANR